MQNLEAAQKKTQSSTIQLKISMAESQKADLKSHASSQIVIYENELPPIFSKENLPLCASSIESPLRS